MPHFSIRPTLRSWVEINLSALRHNLGVVRRKIGPTPEILAVVKANAYGHGTVPVVQALTHDVSIFGVTNLTEAREAASAKTGRDIMLLSPCLPIERSIAAAENLIVTVSELDEASAFASCGTVRVNFKIDTGMGRVGTWWESAIDNIRKIVQMPKIHLHSISTHLPSSDDDTNFTKKQLIHFESLANECRKIAPNVKIHSLNSAGVLSFPEYAKDIVRTGLILYGSSPLPEFQSEFMPALSWKARITLVKDLPAGASVSYGRTFITNRKTRTAVLPIGYADGFPRQASGRNASVIINGVKCPILGRITMDQIVTDITEAGNVAAGDEVVILGKQGNEEILATELAAQADTIAWDIFTGLKSRVERVYSE